MIWTIVIISWQRLRNNRSELLLTFVVPILFFSIFAVIFGSRDSASKTPRIKIALSNPTPSTLSNRAIELLAEQKSLMVTDRNSGKGTARTRSSIGTSATDEPTPSPIVDPATAEDLVRRGIVSAAVVFGESKENETPSIQVMTDSFDQVASQVLTAVVQKAVMTAAGEIAAATAKAQRESSPQFPHANRGMPDGEVRGASFSAPVVPLDSQPPANNLPTISNVDVLGGKKTNPVVAMYAAGIAVMFLLFSATTASGSLLDERENSTLDRLLCSRLTMDQLLMGKWVYLTAIGSIQMTLMFLWGSVVFGIELSRHVEGFAAMTLVTSGAASSFALLLASLCKSRMQLGWISTIVILSMSALGGSMVPRYLMSESIQRFGYVTFNAWALEGYQKVFWRDLPLREVSLELAVLTASGFAFIVVARLLAIRWERA